MLLIFILGLANFVIILRYWRILKITLILIFFTNNEVIWFELFMLVKNDFLSRLFY